MGEDMERLILEEIRTMRSEQRDTRDKVIALGTQMTEIMGDVPSHETRISALEKWRWSIPGAIGLAATALGATGWRFLGG